MLTDLAWISSATTFSGKVKDPIKFSWSDIL